MTDNVGLTGIAGLEAEMRDRLVAKDAEIERLRTALERLVQDIDEGFPRDEGYDMAQDILGITP